MKYTRIQDLQHKSLQKIKTLYEDAFPQRERRDFAQLLTMLQVPEMQLIKISDESVTVGFIILWKFESFSYLEHFAIDPLLRGKNYGSSVMKHILSEVTDHLLLEVEPPHDEISERRIHFYECLGMHVCSFDYQQPPYRKTESGFPMLVMSYPYSLSKNEFEKFTSEVKESVYDKFA